MILLILVVLVIIIVVFFSVQNAVPVAISFLAWHFNASLALIALVFFLAGMIAGVGVMFWTRMRRAARKRSQTGQKQPDSEGHSELPR